MNGALRASGLVAGVLADSLERAALASEHREALLDGRLLLLSPYDPAAGFNVGNAMQRNKLIYALGDAALVVSSDLEKGGTWAGAIEQLDRLRLVPVFVRDSAAEPGNAALIKRGGLPWPEPTDPRQLDATIAAAVVAFAASHDAEQLPSLLREEAADTQSPSEPRPSDAG